MATTTAGASHGGTRNDGATVLNGGTTSGRHVTNTPGKDILGYHSGVHGAVVPESSDFGTHKPFSAGTFAYTMEAGKFIGKRLASTISGVSKTTLLSGAADFAVRRSIHFTESHRRLHITGWDYVTGAATKGGSAGNKTTFKNIRGSGNVDDAAHPTRAIPGELVYPEHHLAKSGSLAVPVYDDYKAKTG